MSILKTIYNDDWTFQKCSICGKELSYNYGYSQSDEWSKHSHTRPKIVLVNGRKPIDNFINLLGKEEWYMSKLPATVGDITREQMKTLMLPAESSNINLDVHYLMALKAKHPGISTPDFVNFVHKAQKFGADPVKDQVHLVAYKRYENRNGQRVFAGYDANAIFSYHFFVSRAEDSGVFDGWDEPETGKGEYFNPETGEFTTTLICKVKIYRTDRTRPIIYTAYYPEFVKTRYDYNTNKRVPTEAWISKPALMLEKCALCNGLKLAFPEQLGGIRSEYDKDEDTPVKEVELNNLESIEVEFETSDDDKKPSPELQSDQDETVIDATWTTDDSNQEDTQISSPDPQPEKVDDPGNHICKVGKFSKDNKPLREYPIVELASYYQYMSDRLTDWDGPLGNDLTIIKKYCIQMGIDFQRGQQ